MTKDGEPGIEWHLPSFLESNGLSVYRLERALAGRVSRNTVYRWARELPASVEVRTLAIVIATLRKLTGKDVNISDLLTFREG